MFSRWKCLPVGMALWAMAGFSFTSLAAAQQPNPPRAGIHSDSTGTVWRSADGAVTINTINGWRYDLNSKVKNTQFVTFEPSSGKQCFVSVNRISTSPAKDLQHIANVALPNLAKGLMERFSSKQRASLLESAISEMQGVSILSYTIILKDIPSNRVVMRRAKEFLLDNKKRDFVSVAAPAIWHYEISCEEFVDSNEHRRDGVIGQFLGSLKLRLGV